MAALIDTNVLIYRYDGRFPEKQRTARELLRHLLEVGQAVLAHQAIVEFVSAATRLHKALDGARRPLLTKAEACREAEELLYQFPVLYPTDEVVRTALRGAAVYPLSWYDAHLWAYAEVNGIPELISEDFQHGGLYGTVRVVNPFFEADTVHEAPGPRYDAP